MATGKKQNYRHLPAFILLVLTKGNLHGGAIHTALVEQLPRFGSDTGAVYRALHELETTGSVSSAWDTTESGPARKIYTLTDRGWLELETWKLDIEMRVANLSYFLEIYEQAKGTRK